MEANTWIYSNNKNVLKFPLKFGGHSNKLHISQYTSIVTFSNTEMAEKSGKPPKILQIACAAQSICSTLWFLKSIIYLLDFSLVQYYAKSPLTATNITSNADGNTLYMARTGKITTQCCLLSSVSLARNPLIDFIWL